MKTLKLVACSLTVAILFLIGVAGPKAHAASAASFDPTHIIDDPIFYNSSSMTIAQIQAFLNSKVPTCDTQGTQPFAGTTRAQYGTAHGYPPPYICLKDYYENPVTQADNFSGSIPSGAQSAAQIIYNAATYYGINPQVLIVLLQKEQGLVTDDWPAPYEYNKATGYGCPDSTGCNSAYYGFFNQVNLAAKQFRNYANYPNSYNYVPGPGNYVLYSPAAGCGGSYLNIQNQATASLYDYTPYQPDAAALAAGYGSGDSCSSYGNRNFWLYFNDWFGSTLYHGIPYPHPNGTLVMDQGQPQVYLIQNGQRDPVPSASSLFSYNYNFGDVKFANYYDDQLPVGPSLSQLKPGTIFKGSGPAIYVAQLVSGTIEKQHFPTWDTFTSLGYTLNDVLTIPDSDIPTTNYPQEVTTSTHPVGALIQQSGQPQVYIVNSDGTRSLFSNQEIFYSYRYNFSQVKTATTADLQLPIGTSVGYREGTLVQGSGPQISVVTGQPSGAQQKALISSWYCFVQLGYTYPTNVMAVPDWEYGTLPTSGPAC